MLVIQMSKPLIEDIGLLTSKHCSFTLELWVFAMRGWMRDLTAVLLATRYRPRRDIIVHHSVVLHAA